MSNHRNTRRTMFVIVNRYNGIPIESAGVVSLYPSKAQAERVLPKFGTDYQLKPVRFATDGKQGSDR